jgi:Protein of unknown function (DUF1501)
MPCGNDDHLDLRETIARRELFSRVGTGLTGIALASLLADDELQAGEQRGDRSRSARRPHFPPKATAVIQLFQHGGPSHMDLLDPKPELNRRNGQRPPRYFTDLVKVTQHGNLLGTPFQFRFAGKSGVEYSEILPHTARCADDIAVIRSMFTEHNNHEQALWHMHTGRTFSGRPTLGAWVNYALGSTTKDLPAYVVLRNDSSLPTDGTRNWSSGFLPPRYQGVHFRHTGTPVRHLQPATPVSEKVSQLRFDLLKKLNARHRAAHPAIDAQLEARIASYELAARMQVSAAKALDLSKETKETQALYGLDNKQTASYGRRCLMARRLVERGVRFVQIFIRGQMWDTHTNNANLTKRCCLETDQPTAALLKDLKRRGLLEKTLVVWGGEFGRTPVSQGGKGRDHHKQGFSLWLAGGGIKGGQVYGATDELGYHAVKDRVKVADLHATILHLLGLDHLKTTFRRNGRDERLTDVYDAKVLKTLLA